MTHTLRGGLRKWTVTVLLGLLGTHPHDSWKDDLLRGYLLFFGPSNVGYAISFSVSNIICCVGRK